MMLHFNIYHLTLFCFVNYCALLSYGYSVSKSNQLSTTHYL